MFENKEDPHLFIFSFTSVCPKILVADQMLFSLSLWPFPLRSPISNMMPLVKQSVFSRWTQYCRDIMESKPSEQEMISGKTEEDQHETEDDASSST